MRKTGIFTIFCFLAFSVFGCGSGELATNAVTNKPAVDSTSNELAMQPDADYAASSNTAAKSASVSQTDREVIATKISLDQTKNASIDTAPTDRKIVRNAELSLEIDNAEEIQRQITTIVEGGGGFVVESQQATSGASAKGHDTTSMSVRVPSQKFAETLTAIRNTSQRVVFENIKGNDVTEEFIDIEARLKAKRSLEQQFMEIMKRAGNVEDALNVQGRLADVRSEIEKIEGRKRFLENQSSLSTIKIKLQTPTAISASSSGFSYRLSESFATGLDFALNFVLGLVTLVVAILPFALVIGLPALLFFRFALRRQNRPRSVAEIAKEELKVT